MNAYEKRVEIIDALRGFALLGLFLVHMVEYFELHWLKPESSSAFEWTFLIFGSKSYAIFALLFGVSFTIIMERQVSRGVNFRLRFCWRITLLAVLGYLHGLIYSGDILQVLAVSGFFLVAVYRLPLLVIFILACLFLLQVPMLLQLALLSTGVLQDTNPIHWSLTGVTLSTYAEGSFADVLMRNIFYAQLGKWLFFFESGRIWHVVGLTLLGFVLGRAAVFPNFKKYRRHCVVGFIVCCFALWLASSIKPSLSLLSLEGSSKRIVESVFKFYVNTTIMFLEVIIFVLLYHFALFKRILDTQAAAGKMSLSMYIAQSIVGVPLFYGFGFALYPEATHLETLFMAIPLWILQLTFAHFWLKYHRYGPMEWVWRALTNMPGRSIATRNAVKQVT